MTPVTVADALDLDVLRHAGPEVVAGADGLTRPVRWVHSTELADIAPLLREGDLLLSTGIALPDSEDGLVAFASSLDASGVAGVVIELGRRWSEAPAALVSSCEALGLPLVVLHHEVRFAAVTQELGERIVDQRLRELREAHEVHETFTELSIGEAAPEQILGAVQQLAGATVVLENSDHQVVDFRPGPSGVRDFMYNWAARSRSVTLDSRTTWDRRQGWLVTRIGRRERGWGRLVVQSPVEPGQRLVAVVERGAAALAMHRLHDRQRDSQVRRSHQELVLGLIHDPTDAQVLRRCEVVGFPLVRHQYVALAVRPVTDGRESLPHVVDDVIAAAVHTAHTARTPALVCEVDGTVRVLLAGPSAAQVDRVADQVAEAIHRRRQAVVGAGRPVATVTEVDRTLRESAHVLSSVKRPETHRVHRLEDVHLRGLLALLGEDDRVRLFVRRELAPLWDHDAQHGTGHTAVLEALLTHPTSKSEAAASVHLSRPVFYDRVARIERLLGVDLDDPDVRVSLHVALVAAQLAGETSD
ncbi:PucR family transcriptional regulator ligand-binding domain-containing protein [Aeromicrobium sp. Leaf350]|uniref:PucR family transcriptional regulator n=1 Tax=Aeromicrobium sp. Leaf350 TaxID=2876565 RepID=UPI001E2B680F|nr:PucR family transcriptional regulator ligand-binding domain-containing protein [Aeromicrobium sp. Leaf350]